MRAFVNIHTYTYIYRAQQQCLSLSFFQSVEKGAEVWAAILLSARSFLLFNKSTEKNCTAHGITNRTFIRIRASWQTTKLLVQSFMNPEKEKYVKIYF